MPFRLGTDLGFARNRYQEPEVWTKIVREDLGLGYVSVVADLFDPCWPDDYLDKLIERTRDCLYNYDIKAEACFTSALTRVPHVMHCDADMRKYYISWFKKFFSMMAKLGCTMGGSHFGIMTFKDYNDQTKREYIINEGIKTWQELTFFARDIGFKCLMFEPMSVPREMGNTVSECRHLLDRVNDHSGIPMTLCLDVGHAPHPCERDPYPWLEQLGDKAPMVHLQQTVLNKSNHSPFTKHFNDTGIIKPEKVMKAIEISGADDVLFAFEITHKEHYDTEFTVIRDLKESAEYWRSYIKD